MQKSLNAQVKCYYILIDAQLPKGHHGSPCIRYSSLAFPRFNSKFLAACGVSDTISLPPFLCSIHPPVFQVSKRTRNTLTPSLEQSHFLIKTLHARLCVEPFNTNHKACREVGGARDISTSTLFVAHSTCELSIQYLFSDTPESLAAPSCLLFPSLQYLSSKAPILCIPLQVVRFWQLPVICTTSNSQDPYLPESCSNFGSKLKILGLDGTFRTPTPYLQFALLCLSLDNFKFELHVNVPVPDGIEVNIAMYSPLAIMFR
ncbi:hypothetical protein M422DRAFT_246346 [Sphaerobolus stellatus SS14]|nr:hypothetical protein M422DRAFT_246346 [Sphaerobolus stellatus SS14]